jgi:hypothetical protein
MNGDAMKKLFFVLVGALVAADQVGAQTCASPLPLFPQGPLPPSTYTGDTCTATNTLPSYGGTGSTQNEIMYSFVAANSNGQATIATTGGFAGTTAMVFLLPSCDSATAEPMAFGTVGGTMSVAGLTLGRTYYLAVTADPGGAPAGCGQYAMQIFGLPVSLQSFSVD